MTDIVKMLRECSSDEAYLSRQAADEITRLRAEIERLTAERDRQYDQNTEQITRIAALEAENEKLRKALDEAQREITQLYEDAAGESM